MRDISVFAVPMNLRRTGLCRKRFLTAMVVPGFIDTHVHFGSAARFLEFNIMRTGTQDEFVEKAREIEARIREAVGPDFKIFVELHGQARELVDDDLAPTATGGCTTLD